MKKLTIFLLAFMANTMYAQTREKEISSDGKFEYYLIKDAKFCGIEDLDGTTIVSLEERLDTAYFIGLGYEFKNDGTHDFTNYPLFAVHKKLEDGSMCYGIYDKTGNTGLRFSDFGTIKVPVPHFINIYTKDGKKEAAAKLQELNNAYAENPSAEILFERAFIYFYMHEYAEAYQGFAETMQREDCSLILFVNCYAMLPIMEHQNQAAANQLSASVGNQFGTSNRRKIIWKSVIGAVPEMIGGATKISSLFARAKGKDVSNDSNTEDVPSKRKDKIWSECVSCKGSKVCRDCGGTHKSAYTKDGECHACSNGVCKTCKGRGGGYI